MPCVAGSKASEKLLSLFGAPSFLCTGYFQEGQDGNEPWKPLKVALIFHLQYIH